MLTAYTRYLEVSLITLDSENTQLAIYTNLIFPLFFYQIPHKTAMLTSMTNKIMNVTYIIVKFLQYSPIGISSTFMLPTRITFGCQPSLESRDYRKATSNNSSFHPTRTKSLAS